MNFVSSPTSKGSIVTIREVAKESGFSSTTVSIVLNNAPLSRYIPAATKKRIERAAKKLGYRPNLFARSLRSKRSHTVGVMVFDMTDPYCTLILRGIENCYTLRGIFIFFGNVIGDLAKHFCLRNTDRHCDTCPSFNREANVERYFLQVFAGEIS